MEAKLIKTGKQFILKDEKGETLAITLGSTVGRKLSLKNCQAIENSYDLEELSANKINSHIRYLGDVSNFNHRSHAKMFQEGFKKALEILGDKKFSEEDIRNAIHFGQFGECNNKSTTISFIQSLQKTEWDVKVEMEEYLEDISYPNGEIPIFRNRPKLDSNACLILSLIKD